MKRLREKECNSCSLTDDVLYRCKYNHSDWKFLCQECLTAVKDQHPDYTYGGTWKARRD